ncbi:hypothetical protein [Rhizobium sp. YTU87027]|uniref:hypothetical protein n=1 Tax=Rhizobium sp. YTU87027 TaxID=3417741 RepID=UPI003D69EE97
MTLGIPLRDDFDGFALRALSKKTKDAARARRLLALAEIDDGHSRSDAARIGRVTLQIVRDWAIRFNTRGPSRGFLSGFTLFGIAETLPRRPGEPLCEKSTSPGISSSELQILPHRDLCLD